MGPGRLRVAALALPALATLAGYALPRSRRASALVRLAALAFPGGAAGLALAGRGGQAARSGPAAGGGSAFCDVAQQAPDPLAAHAEAMVTVMVPARDEAAVISRLVADIGAARSGPLALVVIDDASRDGMADLACAAIEACRLSDVARVVRLTTPSGGKGAALAAVLPPASGVVVVLDADARVAPDFIVRVRAVAATAAAAQARRRMLRPAPGCDRDRGAGLLALLQDGEQRIDALISRVRLRVRGAAEFRGDGMVISAQALRALGGWPHDALCEDLELATRWYLATGLGVEHPANLEIWEQPVLTLRSLLSQRLRWAEGSIRRDLRLVLPALPDPRRPVRRRAELAAYASQALMPWAVLGLAARSCRRPARQQPAGRRLGRAEVDETARGTLGSVVAGYGLVALVLAWASQAPDEEQRAETQRKAAAQQRAALAEREQPAPLGQGVPRGGRAPGLARRRPARSRHAWRLVRATLITAFTGLWALVLPIAWLRVAARPASPRFVRTPHTTPARFSEPG